METKVAPGAIMVVLLSEETCHFMMFYLATSQCFAAWKSLWGSVLGWWSWRTGVKDISNLYESMIFKYGFRHLTLPETLETAYWLRFLEKKRYADLPSLEMELFDHIWPVIHMWQPGIVVILYCRLFIWGGWWHSSAFWSMKWTWMIFSPILASRVKTCWSTWRWTFGVSFFWAWGV